MAHHLGREAEQPREKHPTRAEQYARKRRTLNKVKSIKEPSPGLACLPSSTQAVLWHTCAPEIAEVTHVHTRDRGSNLLSNASNFRMFSVRALPQ